MYSWLSKRMRSQPTLAVFCFELGNNFRAPTTYIYFVVMFVISAMQIVMFDKGVEGTALNSPFQLYYAISSMTLLGLPIVAAIAGQSIHKEFAHQTYPLTLTTPIRSQELLIGRFAAAFLTLLVVFSSTVLGCYVGTLLPYTNANALLENRWLAYIQPIFMVLVPNLFFVAAVVFSLAALGRNMTWVYVSVLLILAANMCAGFLMKDFDGRALASLVEPFGSMAFVEIAKYTTVAEKNSQLVPLTGFILANRLIWSTLALGILFFTLIRFRVSPSELRRDADQVDDPTLASQPLSMPTVAPPTTRWSGGSWALYQLRLLPRLALGEFLVTVKSLSFLAVLMTVGWVTIYASRHLGADMGTSVHPLTSNMIVLGQRGIDLFVFATITLYAGQLIWREREAGMAPLCDTQPTSSWLPLLSKLVALMLVQATLFSFVIACAVLLQAIQGHYQFELGVYIQALLGIELFQACLICVLAIAVQVTLNHKFLAHFVMVLFYVFSQYAGRLGFEHHLLQYASHPGYVYSDMNGFGDFIRPILWFNLFWLSLALLLMAFANALWVRGQATRFWERFRMVGVRLRQTTGVIACVSCVSLLGTGWFIYYNTNVINVFQSRRMGEVLKAEYEHEFKPFESMPQPSIHRVDLSADIFPETRNLHLNGNIQLINKTDQSIRRVLITAPPHARIETLQIGEIVDPVRVDSTSGARVYELPEPLLPGAFLPLDFDLRFEPRGFTNHMADTHIVSNGTYFDASFIPRIGYVSGYELSSNKTRQKYGLGPKSRLPDVHDQEAHRCCVIAPDADWIEFTATLSTSSDQIAVAPGALVRQWQADGRSHYQYQADAPMMCFFSILSARYKVYRERWRDVDLEIYYHPGHEYNLETMARSMRLSLEYYVDNFGPYQNKQLRIVEVPRTHPSAKAFCGTIPFSEGAGFILKPRSNRSRDLEIPFYITAHEVAHQWWAHQVVGPRTQGSFMLSESLAQYSALMVMKREFNAAKMKRILRAELDQYLKGRANSGREMPLALEERQAWVHYQKGSLAFYALQDFIGEDKLNAVLKDFVAQTAFQGPPYPTSLDLVERLRETTPPEFNYLIDDLFTTITLYDCRALSATARRLPEGTYEVELEVDARKFKGSRRVGQDEVSIDDFVDIGITNAIGRFQYLKKHRIRSNNQRFTIVVPSEPAQAGIDPRNILIDRQPDDNMIAVETN